MKRWKERRLRRKLKSAKARFVELEERLRYQGAVTTSGKVPVTWIMDAARAKGQVALLEHRLRELDA